MGESETAVDFRLVGVLRREEGTELLLGLDLACVLVAEFCGPLEQSGLHRLEQSAGSGDEVCHGWKLFFFGTAVTAADRH